MPTDQQPQYTTVVDGEVRTAPAPAKEPTINEKQDAMNSAPASASDYQLPEIRIDGEAWQPNPAESAAIDGCRALAHAANLPAFEFANLAEIVSRPGYAVMAPEAAEGHLRNEWGGQYEHHATVVAAVLERVEAKHPGAMRFLEDSGLGNNVDLIQALYRAGSRRR